VAAVPSTGRATGLERESAPEADAARALYERYAGQLYGFCLNRLGSREEAEDAVQTTFLNAFRGLRRGVVPEAESAWLFKIAENVCLTRRRSTWRRGRVESPSDMQALQDVTPARETDGGDELIPLGEALAAMPETQRRAILLREWQGLSYKEIAYELDVSQSAVETLIFRARRSLANALETPWQERRAAGRAGRRAFDLGSLLAGLKTLFAGGSAAKVAALAAVAATGTAALAVADTHRPAASQRAEPSAVAARAADSAARRAVLARPEHVGPADRMAASALPRPPKPEQRPAATKAGVRAGGAALGEGRLKPAKEAAASSTRSGRKTPPGQAKEPGTPASPRARASRPEPKVKAKPKPKSAKPKSKPKAEAKPTSKADDPESEQPKSAAPAPPSETSSPEKDKAKDDED
jgi:RNA polymerase sigma factor (sigma-70 family)